MSDIGALAAQISELDSLLTELSPSDWERATRCAPMTVKELVVHVANVLPFWQSFLDATPEQATSDRVEWWRYDAATESPKILARAQKAAAGLSADDARDAWRANSGSLIAAYRTQDPARLVGRAHIALTLADLAAIGCVEVGVHTMDVGHATNKGERIHPDAVPIVVGVLESLAAEPLPDGLGWDDRTFILTATGRRDVSPTERHVLGPLAAKFPLLS